MMSAGSLKPQAHLRWVPLRMPATNAPNLCNLGTNRGVDGSVLPGRLSLIVSGLECGGLVYKQRDV